MLPRSLTMGLFVLAGSSLLSAADPLIPPAPTPGVGKSFTAPPIPSPPTPHLPAVPAPPAAIPASPPAPSSTPIPESTTVVPPEGSLSTPSVVPQMTPYPQQTVSPQSVPSVGNEWIVPSAAGAQGFPVGTVWGDSQTGNPGLPAYNSFATQPNFFQNFHTGPAGGEHARYPYYSYRRPWYTPGPISRNMNIVW